MVQHDASPITALRQAVPYLRLFQDSTFVIKAGGEVFDDEAAARSLLEQVGILHQLKIRVVLVHGGGPQTSRIGRSLGVEPDLVDGRRITSAATRDVSTMALNGTVNTRALALCRALDIPAVGLSGVDAGLVMARRRPPRDMGGRLVDFGYVGDIESTRPRILQQLTETGFLPVVSPLSADANGEVLNLNADGVAATLAVALNARKLILMTGAPGILVDPADPHHFLSIADLADLDRLEEEGALKDGMLPKAAAIRQALHGEVERVHVISHRVPDSLLLELFTNEGSGTMVVRDRQTQGKEVGAGGDA